MPFMWALWLCRSAQTIAAVLFAGTAVLRLLARNTGVDQFAPWNRLAWTAGGVFLGAAVLQLGLTAADMSGLPLTQACSARVLGSVLGSTLFGAVWKARLLLLAAAFVIGWCVESRRARGSAFLELAPALLAAALLATLVWSGHAHASDQRAWLLPADLLHVLAAGAWPGGLLPLALLLACTRRDATLVPSAITITRRFSRMSLAAVSVLAASGLLNSYGLLRTLPAIWETPYGRLILVKLGLFAIMICLGAMNRRRIHPSPLETPADTVRRLGRNVAWECVLAAGVLLATEALTMHAPPAAR